MSRHLIFGAGLIGGYMAGCFASKGLSVSVVGRESMRQRFAGDFIISDYLQHKTTVSTINFITNEEGCTNHFDFIWITVKCTGLQQALVDMSPFVGPHTVILSCQNGLGSDTEVQVAFPKNEVRRVIMTSNIAQESDTHLHRGSQGDLLIEAYVLADGISLAATVSCDLLVAQSIDDMDAYSWSKLQLNLTNAINALADIPVKQMLEQRAYRRVIALVMQELLDVARAKGLSLPKLAAVPMHWVPKVLNTPDFLFSILGTKMMDIDPSVRTSMWWDLSVKRLTEVDFLNGAVVNHGQAVGVECPVNQRVVELIHHVEQSDNRMPFSPEAFLKSL